ncbi:putative permease [Silvibacterium bohemicum]|uniref:Putative permease n=1 Tax=Silvibacterium bohemicum TaxID=1577686 RepID=A0A841JX87_9BACT|nr:ABC transporter permease [Silvibacterium bohemicum]MBB6145175.1 putative permease [Silvibacterium bohemicum]
MRTLLHDFRFSFRQLQKSPGFALTAVLSLALGIGATTAVFSVIYAVLMNPYPYAAPDRMVHMRLLDSSAKQRFAGLTGSQWQTIRKSPVVEDAFISDDWNLTVTGHDLPEDVNGVYMTSNSFNYMGVPPALGRGLIPSDAIDGQDPQPVAVLGYKFWQRHFNGDPAVLGQTMQLVRKNYRIVGVAAPRFTWDDGDVYLPLKITQDPARSFYVGLRLKPGVTHAMAAAALTPLIQQFAKETPDHFPKDRFTFQVIGLNEDFIHQIGGTLALLFCAVALLLAIGCGNVSILLLARGTARQHEFAVRAAIGATRRRIVRQLLTEALLLSLTGTALGVVLAYRLVALIVAMLPPYSFPHEAAIAINLPVLAFSVGVALLTGILFGLWPAVQLSHPEVSQVMQSSTRRIAGGVRGRSTNNVLIAGQIALTLLMLAGAAAAMEGFLKLLHTPLGYDPHNVISVGIPVHENTYTTVAERAAYFELLRKKVADVPGVTMAAISSNATPPANGSDQGIEILGRPPKDEQKIRVNFVSPGYFPILHIQLAHGRIWDETENHNAARLAVINQTMARLYFPNGDAIGRSFKIPDLQSQARFVLSPMMSPEYLEIVGIIADKRDDGLRNSILPEAFIPYTLSMRMYTQILVRSDVPPLSLLHTIGAAVNSVDPDQQINANVQDLEHWISDQQEWQQEHLVAWLFGSFAVLALALAAVGLYSVVSYTVAQRTNEFGIRMALGAQRAHVLRIVFLSTVASVGGGILGGIALTLALQKLLARWAEGSSRDPLILLGAVGVLGTVAAIACLLPALRASQVDPMTALRYE